MLALLLAVAIAVSNTGATCPLPARSRKQVTEFRKTHPCPVTGKTKGACPGYAVDHIRPLACCGKDDPSNMQWLSDAAHKEKHKFGLQCEMFYRSH